jgi:hypothetical protein
MHPQRLINLLYRVSGTFWDQLRNLCGPRSFELHLLLRGLLLQDFHISVHELRLNLRYKLHFLHKFDLHLLRIQFRNYFVDQLNRVHNIKLHNSQLCNMLHPFWS